MKHILLSFIILILTIHFAQAQNDMKARLEYEDAETAFQKGEYRKAIDHLNQTEKLLGMWTAKTGYLKTIALDIIIDYAGDWNDNLTALSQNVDQYMKYANQNSDKVELEKVREIYAIEKRLNFAKKKRDSESDSDYKAAKEAYDNKNYSLAMTHYLNAANKNNTRAMDKIGDMYRDGIGFRVDYQKSLEWDTKAFELGDPISASDIGDMYFYGYGVTKDYKKALDYLHMGADYGSGYAMAVIGRMYGSGFGVTRNYQESVAWISKAVDKESSEGMFRMAIAYFLGNGVEQNYTEALKWYKRAADKGHIGAPYSIGSIYNQGQGVEQNYIQAKEWYLKAADIGHYYAMRDIGHMFFNGKGAIKNYQTALDWYQKSLTSGILKSDADIGLIYLNMGTCYYNLKNYSKSMELYAKAYEIGTSEVTVPAKEMIARMYDEGLGIEKDKRKAREWRSK